VARLKDPKVLAVLVVALAAMVAGRLLMPVPLPHIQLPAETLAVLPGNLGFTNTMLGILVADLLLIVVALVVRSGIALVPSGAANVFEAVVEFWQDQGEQLVGPELARRWLPLVLTIFLLVGVANLSGLIPGYDYVGIACTECPEAEGATPTEHTHFLGREVGPFFFALERPPADVAHAAEGEGEAHEEVPEAEHVLNGLLPGTPGSMAVVPYLRPAASDLNLTVALALIAFGVIQFAGIRALGVWGYFSKFLNVSEGVLGLFVGLVEAISEVARIISFSFRLFGNVFAGMILLFVMPFLIPLFVVLPFMALEMFVGLIQAYVFAVLTLAFMAGAVTPHHHPSADHH